MADSQEKTEQATDKRMREVREKGQLSRSQDLMAWLAVGGAAAMLPATIDHASNAAVDQLFTVKGIINHPDPAKAAQYVRWNALRQKRDEAQRSNPRSQVSVETRSSRRM